MLLWFVFFFFLTKLEISGHEKSNYLLLFSSRMQENKNHLNLSLTLCNFNKWKKLSIVTVVVPMKSIFLS